MQPRIQWTTREREQIAMRVMALEATSPGMSFNAMITQAQLVLPEYRRRTIPSAQAVPWLRETKDNLKREGRSELKKAEEKKAEPTPSASAYEVLVERLLKELPDLLLDKLAERLTSRIAAPTQDFPVEEVAVDKETLTKVLVVGVLPQQARELEAEFAGLLNIRTWKEEGPKTLKALARTSSLILIMADKVSHSAQFLAKSAMAKSGTLQYVSGGVTNIKVELEKYYIEKV